MVVKKKSKRIKSKSRKTEKKSKSWSLSNELLSSKEMSKFRSSKSISLASRLSGIKETLVSELLDLPVSESIYSLCSSKLENHRYLKPSTNEKKKITKELANSVCHCLMNKNKDLSVTELENKVKMKIETPGSECIKILDDHFEKKK